MEKEPEAPMEKKEMDDARLLYLRIALKQKIHHYESELKHASLVFLICIGATSLGLLSLYCGSVEAFAVLMLVGFVSLFGSVYVGCYYPSQLERMRQELQQLQDFGKIQHAFPRPVRNRFAKAFQRVYERLLNDVMKWTTSNFHFRSYALPTGIVVVGLATLVSGLLRGLEVKAVVAFSGIAIMCGILLALLRHANR